jgi:hypothetical protein
MKTISIGDIHGKDVWKQIDITLYDKVIFVGDYVDDFDISNEQMVRNLSEIIQLKKGNPEKVILLLGNHDIQYIHWPDFKCSGFNTDIFQELRKLFLDNINLFKIAHQEKDILWTHAGVSNLWLEANNLIDKVKPEWMAFFLNELYRNKHFDILFQVGPRRRGKAICGGPLWADRTELTPDKIYNEIHQIAGHNRCLDVTIVNSMGNWYINCNCLEDKTIFFEFEI